MSPQAMHIESFFDPTTFTFSHILADLHSKKCALIDSLLDYDPKSGRTSTANANRLIARVNELGLSVQWLLETHVHADHISAAPYLQKHVGGQLAIGAHITTVQTPAHPLALASQLKAPVLGLYGDADTSIPLDTVEKMKAALAQGPGAAKSSEFVVYPEAPHAFHADYRPTYRKAAADDGWQRMLDWFRKQGAV